MRRRLRELLWRLFGWPDIPPQKCVKLVARVNQYTGFPLVLRRDEMTSQYLAGHDIETIAEMHNVTRERVRQCLWKAYRES